MDEQTFNESNLLSTLRRYYGYNHLGNDLLEVTKAICLGDNAYVRMPDGFEKCLCYQLPVLTKNYTYAIVISSIPNFARLHIEYLKQKHVVAYLWNIHFHENTMNDIANKKAPNYVRFLYMTPEQCETPEFENLLSRKSLLPAYIVINEHYFNDKLQPGYTRLIKLRRDVPLVIFNTSTRQQVKLQDIAVRFGLLKGTYYEKSFLKPHIFYDVWFMEALSAPEQHLREYITTCIGPSDEHKLPSGKRDFGIVFCREDEIRRLTNFLLEENIPAVAYHENDSSQDHDNIYKLWESGRVAVIVASTICKKIVDKETIRFIVHYKDPWIIENVYEESEMIGLDLKASYYRVYFSCEDYNHKWKFKIPFTKHIIMRDYKGRRSPKNDARVFGETISVVTGLQCRHLAFSEGFGIYNVPKCGTKCDACQDNCYLAQRLSDYKYHLKLKLEAAQRKVIPTKSNNWLANKYMKEECSCANSTYKSEKIWIRNGITTKLRESSFYRIRSALLDSIEFHDVKLNKILDFVVEDMMDIAHVMELSIFRIAQNSYKYRHFIRQKIKYIQKCGHNAQTYEKYKAMLNNEHVNKYYDSADYITKKMEDLKIKYTLVTSCIEDLKKLKPAEIEEIVYISINSFFLCKEINFLGNILEDEIEKLYKNTYDLSSDELDSSFEGDNGDSSCESSSAESQITVIERGKEKNKANESICEAPNKDEDSIEASKEIENSTEETNKIENSTEASNQSKNVDEALNETKKSNDVSNDTENFAEASEGSQFIEDYQNEENTAKTSKKCKRKLKKTLKKSRKAPKVAGKK